MRTCWDRGVSTPVCGGDTLQGWRRTPSRHPGHLYGAHPRSHLEEEGTLHRARRSEAPAGPADSLVLHRGHSTWGQWDQDKFNRAVEDAGRPHANPGMHS